VSFYKNKEILITGGTGTLGKEITKQLLNNHPEIRGIRIFSRDEEKHRLMEKQFGKDKPISYLVGNIENRERLFRALNGVDIVFHTAAMKQVPLCESNPIEAVRTNIDGSANVIDASIDNIVEQAMFISSDKACYPINIYGISKAAAEKLFIHSGVYSPHHTKLGVCRYGNVIASRGSVIPIFKKQYAESKTITVTDVNMTRFWIQLQEVAKFVINCMTIMQGGELFIPDMKSASMKDLIDAVLPERNIIAENIPIRKGEKMHECLITKEEFEYLHIITDPKVKGYYINNIKNESGNNLSSLNSYNSEKWEIEDLRRAINENAI